MYEDSRYEYTIRTCDSEDVQELENILNEMALQGWELYSLNEAETEEGDFRYLCIFSKAANGNYEFEDDCVVDAGDFKSRMNKLLHKKEDLYEECRFLQKQVREKNQQIEEIKHSLDSSPEEEAREDLNKKISERINELNLLKSKFSELLSPVHMYDRISQDMLTIVVSYELAELIDNEQDGDLIAESVRLRQKLTDSFGYVIPRVHFVISDEMNENQYKIKVRNLKILEGTVYPKHKRFFIGQSNIQTVPEEAIEDVDLISGQQVFWLDESKTKNFWENGMTPSQVIMNHLEVIAHRYADEILSYEDILNYIALLDERKAFLAEDLILNTSSIGDLRYVFANLIREKVSVRDITFIFEKLNDLYKYEYNNEELLKELRVLLRKHICSQVGDSNNTICAITIPGRYKKLLSKSLITNNEKKYFNENNELKKFIKYVTDAVDDATDIVLISEPGFRQPLFNLFEKILPGITVISEDEIAEEFTLQEI